jgi:1-acyl-sn-glycerol-3-phosphate acyltransferase
VSWLGEPDWPRERLWAWRLGFPPVRGMVTWFLRIDVEGRELVPRSGGYILAANHISWLDPPIIEFGLGIPIRYMAKRELFSVPLLGAALRAIGAFPVRRGASDRRAIETALRVVAAGQPLGFFPEGTRSKDGTLKRAKPGISFLVRRSGAPIVPVAVAGTRGAGIRLGPRPDIRVRIGRPLAPSDLPLGDDQATADAIMRRIAELLPPKMRGTYHLD